MIPVLSASLKSQYYDILSAFLDENPDIICSVLVSRLALLPKEHPAAIPDIKHPMVRDFCRPEGSIVEPDEQRALDIFSSINSGSMPPFPIDDGCGIDWEFLEKLLIENLTFAVLVVCIEWIPRLAGRCALLDRIIKAYLAKIRPVQRPFLNRLLYEHFIGNHFLTIGTTLTLDSMQSSDAVVSGDKERDLLDGILAKCLTKEIDMTPAPGLKPSILSRQVPSMCATILRH